MMFFAVLCAMISSSCLEDKSSSILDMRCEYLKSPINIDVEKPRFTWTYQLNNNKSYVQAAYKVDVALNKKDLEQGSFLWSSDRVSSTVSKVEYNGEKELESHTKYYWQITSWDEDNKVLKSAIDSFEVAKIHAADWAATWISDKHDKGFGPAPMFRKSFDIQKDIAEARLYISAASYYKLYINGVVPNTEKLDPGYTHYDKRNLYTTIDVTSALQQGENVVAAVLGNGFYNADAPVATWDFEKAHWRDRAKMIMELRVKYADGTTMIVPTDDTWKTTIGPHVYNNIYSGETYDARKEIEGWNKPNFVDLNWDSAKSVESPSSMLVSQSMDPIRVTKEIPAIAMQSFGDTIFVFDMGINLTGVCNIKLSGQKDTKVTLTHGELLKDNGRLEMRNLDI